MASSLADALVARGMTPARASALVADLDGWRHMYPAEICWQLCTQRWLTPEVPFPVHHHLYDFVFEGWDEGRGPRPAWIPSAEEAAATNLGAFMRAGGFTSYRELHQHSVTQRAVFWRRAIDRLGLQFRTPCETILDLAAGPEQPRWLRGARFNIVDSCFLAPEQATAIVSGDPDGTLTRMSYRQLAAEVAAVTSALRAAGFVPGDALAIDLPMTSRAVAIYLGIVAAGMVVVSIADSLAAEEVATRLRIARAVGLFTALDVLRAGKKLPLYHKVLAAQPPRAIVLDARGAALRAGDLTFEDFLAVAPADILDPLPGDPDTITNILFSSGTTGEPKAIPWTQLAPIKSAVDGALHLDIRAGDVVAWPTNLGWMMGPWLIYASLLNRATIALYSDVPTGRGFGEFVSRAKVNVLGLVPSIVKAWRSDDRLRGLDFSAIRCFGSTGEASNAVDYLYLMMLAGYRPVIEYCGGTEIGGGYLTGTLVEAASPATFTTPALGSELVLLDESGHPTDNGEVFLVPPTLGYSQSLLNRDHHQVYYAGTPPGPGGQLLRRHGDQLQRLGGGYYRALGRVDDTMNLGGIKVSSAEIERVLDAVPGISRTAAVAINPPGGGPSELVVYVVPADPASDGGGLTTSLQQALKTRLNPLFRIFDVVVVPALPVTASNKILRRELRAQYQDRVQPVSGHDSK
jgi:acetyl-CoA synthetase